MISLKAYEPVTSSDHSEKRNTLVFQESDWNRRLGILTGFRAIPVQQEKRITVTVFERGSAEEKEVSVVGVDCGAEMGLNEGRGFDQ